MCKQFQAALDIWDREEHEQIQENLLQLENALKFISRKANGFINPAIERALHNWGLIDMQLEDVDYGRAPRGASADFKGVSVLEYPVLTRCTQQVAYRVSWY